MTAYELGDVVRVWFPDSNLLTAKKRPSLVLQANNLQTRLDQLITGMITTFKRIRKLRQYPAHTINEDIFDQGYFKQQREIVIKAYEGVSLLRLIFANHPNVKGYKIPDWLHSGIIWTY